MQDGALGTGPEATAVGAVILAPSIISIEAGCPPTIPKRLKATRTGTRVRASWSACDGFSAALIATIAPDCRTMNGTLRTRWKEGKGRRKEHRRKFNASVNGTTVTTTTTTTVPATTPGGGLQVRWTVSPPAVVDSGQDLGFEIEVSGCGASVEGNVLACPSRIPVAECDGADAFQIDADGGYFSGPPGTFAFTASAFDCSGPEDFYVVPRVFVDDALGNSFGPVFGPVTPIQVRAPTASLLQVDPPALAFSAAAGQTPTAQVLSLSSVCGDAFPYTASADAAWVTITPRSGNLLSDGTRNLTVSVNPAALPTQGASSATITVTSPALARPVVVPLAFDPGAGVTVQWTTGAPASVASEQIFPLELEVGGSFENVEGDVVACTSDVPVDECTDAGVFDLGAGGGHFFGPPGRFAFTARGLDCYGPEAFYLVARYSGFDADGNARGPFTGPATRTRILAPTAPLLDRDPPALTFNAVAGQAIPSQTVTVFTVCGERLAFSAAASVPWLTVTPASRTIPLDGSVDLTIGVNLAGLDPGGTPFNGMISLAAGTGGSHVDVPITLNLIGDLSVRWTTPAPATVSSGQSFALALRVDASVPKVDGQIVSCFSDQPVDQCADTGLFDLGPDAGTFTGAPGDFTFLARGFDCNGPENVYLAAQIFVTDAAGNVVGPFLGPVTSTSLLAPPAPILQTDTDSLAFNLVAGQSPVSQTLALFSACGEPTSWTGTTTGAPWLSVAPARGTIQAGESADVTVTAGPSGVDSTTAPLAATLTLEDAANASRVTVPVTLNLLGCGP